MKGFVKSFGVSYCPNYGNERTFKEQKQWVSLKDICSIKKFYNDELSKKYHDFETRTVSKTYVYTAENGNNYFVEPKHYKITKVDVSKLRDIDNNIIEIVDSLKSLNNITKDLNETIKLK